MTIYLHDHDLPADVFAPGSIAVDTETMGLHPARDRLCLVQLADGHGDEHLVRFDRSRLDQGRFVAPVLAAVLTDPARTKLYHFARFDLAVLKAYLGIVAGPVFCTKIASKLVRTYTDRHGLKDMLRETIGVDVSKAQQSSDWGGPVLSDAQKDYAASDVRYLHRAVEVLTERLAREGRTELAQACFDFLPWRAELDLAGWSESDIFAHL